MAKRVNTRFVIGLSIALLLVGLGLSAMWYVVVRSDPTEYVVRGRELASRGEHELAVRQFALALQKMPNNVDLLLDQVEAMSKVQIEDGERARQYVRQMQSFLDHALDVSPGHEEAFTSMMSLYMELGDRVSHASVWDGMYARAEQAVQNRPEWALARKYRGIALVNRLRTLDLPPEQREQARRDLKLALDTLGDDHEASFHLALGWALEANLAQRDGRPDEAQQMRQTAATLARESADAAPGDLGRQLDLVHVLFAARQQDEARARLDQVVGQLSGQSHDADQSLRLAEMLIREGQQTGLEPLTGWDRAEQVLRQALQRWPENAQLKYSLAQAQVQLGEHEQALNAFGQLRESPIKATPAQALLESELRLGSEQQYAQLLVGQIADAQDPEKRQQLLTELDQSISQIAAVAGETASVNMLMGKQAMLTGDTHEAAKRFDLAADQFHDANPESLLLAARSWYGLGEWGVAVQRLERLTLNHPNAMHGQYALVRLYLQMNELEQARDRLDGLLRAHPDNSTLLYLRGMQLTQQNRYDEALAVYDRLAERHPGRYLVPRVQLLNAAGKTDQALSMIDNALAQDPTNVGALQQAMVLAPSDEQAAAYLDQAREAGLDEQSAQLLEAARQPDARQRMADRMLSDVQGEPFDQAMSRYTLLQSMGRSEEADQALAQASELNPNDRALIETRFERALRADDFEQATQLLQQARQQDVDRAGGWFFQGRLQLAQGQARQAVQSFRRGLQQRQIYSEGWRLLGQAQLQVGDPSSAVDSFRQSVDQRPTAEAMRGLARALHEQGEHDAALEQYRRAYDFAPSDPATVMNYLDYESRFGDAQRALELRQQIAQQNPQNVPNRRELALLQARMGNLDQARQTLDALREQQGDSLLLVAALAAIEQQAGNPQQAVTIAESYLSQQQPEPTPEDYRLVARARLGVGDVDGAVEAFEHAMAAPGGDRGELAVELAQVLVGRGEAERAAQYLARVWEQNPDDAENAQRYVELLIQLDRHDQAEAVAAALVEDTPARAVLLQGLVDYARGDLEAARQHMDQAVEAAPQWALAYVHRARVLAQEPGGIGQAVKDLDRARELAPQEPAVYRVLASVRAEEGETEDAIRALRRLIELRPTDRRAYLQLDRLLSQQQRWLDLRSVLQQATAAMPQDPLWLERLSRLEARLDRPEQALAQAKRAWELAGDGRRLVFYSVMLSNAGQNSAARSLIEQHGQLLSPVRRQALLGRFLGAGGEAAAAVEALTAAAAQASDYNAFEQVVSEASRGLEGDQVATWLNSFDQPPHRDWGQVGLARLEMGAGDLDGAAQRIAELEAPSTEQGGYLRALLITRAQLGLQRGHFSEAAADYQRLLEIDPQNLMALNNLAYIMNEHLGDAEQAVELADQAVRLAPDNAQVLDTLGWAQHQRGQGSLALRTLGRSVELEPRATNSFHFARVLLDQGQRRYAREMLQAALAHARREQDQSLQTEIQQTLDQLDSTNQEVLR